MLELIEQYKNAISRRAEIEQTLQVSLENNIKELRTISLKIVQEYIKENNILMLHYNTIKQLLVNLPVSNDTYILENLFPKIVACHDFCLYEKHTYTRNSQNYISYKGINMQDFINSIIK